MEEGLKTGEFIKVRGRGDVLAANKPQRAPRACCLLLCHCRTPEQCGLRAAQRIRRTSVML